MMVHLPTHPFLQVPGRMMLQSYSTLGFAVKTAFCCQYIENTEHTVMVILKIFLASSVSRYGKMLIVHKVGRVCERWLLSPFISDKIKFWSWLGWYLNFCTLFMKTWVLFKKKKIKLRNKCYFEGGKTHLMQHVLEMQYISVLLKYTKLISWGVFFFYMQLHIWMPVT